MTDQKKIYTKIFPIFVFAMLISLTGLPPTAVAGEGKKVIKQLTLTSATDPIPGHGAHQLILLLGPEAGKVYTGTVTFTASKPVEVVVLHEYNIDKMPGMDHGNVLIGEIGGKKYALSLMQFSGDMQVTNSSTVNFTGSGLALHTLNGEKFTATATVNAIQEKIQP
ncbi:hypothetical protein MNBD_NITROSPIRAE01-2362 [hydrothermal vent metagenome]|uniref:Uncharacterized protein n=1 Tax=hydrothermal vent metagenome TaxID=652676 RepID=A0A3B1CCK5_9ZZZZ